MAEEVRFKVSEYIMKFKGNDDIHGLYREFDYKWLNSFDDELAEKVKIEFDCVLNERIWGDGEDDELVMNDLISSLEDLLK